MGMSVLNIKLSFLLPLFLLVSTVMMATNYHSSGDKKWVDSGFPETLTTEDTVFIHAPDSVYFTADININGVLVIDTLAQLSGTMKININLTGTLHNDGGKVNITDELHVDGSMYNTGRINVKNLHSDGYICNSKVIILEPGKKFNFHGGTMECCGSVLADVIIVHANGGTPATSDCQSICSTNESSNPTFEGITEFEFLNNTNPTESILNTTNSGLCLPGALLPISLVSFKAYIIEEAVVLEWITSTETNNDYFTIERSVDAKRWEELMEINGAGNSSQFIEYIEKDYEPLDGISYYRLKQTDFNGDVFYSNTESVKFENDNFSLNLFPNPINFGETLEVDFNRITGKKVFLVMRDVTGRTYFSRTIIDYEEEGILGIPFNKSIPAGVYLITASSENDVFSKKLIVR